MSLGGESKLDSIPKTRNTGKPVMNSAKTWATERLKNRVEEIIHREPDTPLFLIDTLDGQKGDAQDEKDKFAE